MSTDKKVAWSATDFGKVPTPAELAARALKDHWFQWNAERARAEASVAAVIEEDRARVRGVVNRARQLIPALFRDLDASLGGR